MTDELVIRETENTKSKGEVFSVSWLAMFRCYRLS